ncbi:MAG TPA: hypothetical protein VEB62_02560 [Brevundimonas sp.]|nr:hypothetical protein [Brevundimonas sp.]
MTGQAARSPRAVLDDHLARRLDGDIEGDLAANYAPGVTILTKDGVYSGWSGIRQTAALLERMLPEARFSYDVVRVADELAILSWSAVAANGARTCWGADSYLIRNGLIVGQTIQYEVRQPGQK